jgi:hypothetical protein
MNLEHFRTKVSKELPEKVRWVVERTPLEIDFTKSRSELSAVSNDDGNYEAQEKWKDLYIFGEEDFSEGGGANPGICVNKHSGKIYGFDPEREECVYFINSDIESYIKTFLLFDDYLRHQTITQTALSKEVKLADKAFDKSEWKLLLEYVTENNA